MILQEGLAFARFNRMVLVGGGELDDNENTYSSKLTLYFDMTLTRSD